MTVLPNNENTYNAQLKKKEDTPSTDQPSDQSYPNNGYVDVQNSPYVPYRVVDYDNLLVDNLASKTPSIPKVQYTIGKKVLSLDVETTGLNPWEYKMVVCSVWDLDEPKAQMRTFAGWDEEQVVRDLFAYIESKKPEVILAFNAKFECRCFLSRAMLYQIPSPWIFTADWHDMLTILEGGWKNGLLGTMPSGSEENWLKFFFNEEKPYTIEECFEGIRQGRLDEMIIRNRTCVQGQGDMYQLLMYVQQSGEGNVGIEKPTAAMLDEGILEGIATVECGVCAAINEVTTPQNPGQCWRCSANLPAVTAADIIREVSRPVDWSLVGLSGDKLKAAQKAQKENPVKVTLQPVDQDNIAAQAAVRLAKIYSQDD